MATHTADYAFMFQDDDQFTDVEFGKTLRAEMKAQEFSVEDLAQMTGISKIRLKAIIRPTELTRGVTRSELNKIQDCLGGPSETLRLVALGQM